MSNILQELEAEIKKATASVSQENVGVIRSVGDGVAKIEGLSGVMLNEMIEFPGGVMGLAMNLEEHEVGAVILGDDSNLKEGDLVKCSGRLLSVPVGRSLLGRVVNTLGEPIDGKGPIEAEAYYPVEKIASGIISRQSVTVPVQTGILPIDAMIPIGRGQRELIIGDRATGKTAIAMDTMIAQADQNRLAEEGKLADHQPLYNIYVATPERANISQPRGKLEERSRNTPSWWRPPPPTLPPCCTWPRMPAARWANTSWTRGRTPSSSTTTSPNMPWPTARFP